MEPENPAQNQIIPVCIFKPYVSNIHLNVILPSIPRCPSFRLKILLTFRVFPKPLHATLATIKKSRQY